MAAYRERSVSCPHCGDELTPAGARLGCASCKGMWIEERVLDEMVREMHDGAGALRLTARERDREVSCPVCRTTLDNVLLEGVPVERCPARHGVWFDADELQVALRAVAAGEPAARPEAGGVPDVRIGFWRGLLGDIGSFFGLMGTAVAGTAVIAAGVATTSSDPADQREARRVMRDAVKPDGDL